MTDATRVSMQIAELAERVGVNPKTIRYYEEIGVLPPPDRAPSGYRTYGDEDAERLVFIRRAQQLGLHLDEIREILALREQGARPCDYVLGIARRRIDELDQRIVEMHHAREQLIAALDRADDLGDDAACYCQLIEHNEKLAAPSS